MDINQLRYFISVAQTLNFSSAARRNGITQPTISHHISELEKQLNCRLFNRSKRTVELTQAGQLFLTHAIEIVDIAEKAAFQVQQVQNGQTGSIAISALTTSSATLSKCLAVFASRWPNITADITFTGGQTQLLAVSENKVDFHFAVEDMIPEGSGFQSVVTNQDRLCVAVPSDHFLAEQPLDFTRLSKERFISVTESDSPALYRSIQKICMNRNFFPRVVCKCDRVEAVLLSVGAGLGIAILPEALSHVFYARNVRFIPIDGKDAERTYVVAWPKEHINPVAKLFQSVVEELYGPSTK